MAAAVIGAFSMAGLVLAPSVVQASRIYSCAPPPGFEAEAAQMLALVNHARTKAGLVALSSEKSLTRAAQSHACDSAERDRMGHVSSDGSTLSQRVKAAGYRLRLAAENVAYGFQAGSRAMGFWMGSPGHRANILLSDAREIGLGIARAPGSGRLHWVMVVARGR